MPITHAKPSRLCRCDTVGHPPRPGAQAVHGVPMHARAVTERAKLSHPASMRPVGYLLLCAVLASGCGAPSPMTPVYDPKTRELVRLDYDYDGNGTVDVRTHLRLGKPVRLEGDTNQDLVMDRWEYYDDRGGLLRLGTASANDGVEDTWVYESGADTRIEIATRRDRVVDRWEYYRDGALLRTERDTNRDGKPDTWEDYEQGRVRQLSMDETYRGRPTRRMIYGEGGSARVEVDPDGDGQFEAAGAGR